MLLKNNHIHFSHLNPLTIYLNPVADKYLPPLGHNLDQFDKEASENGAHSIQTCIKHSGLNDMARRSFGNCQRSTTIRQNVIVSGNGKVAMFTYL